MKLRLVRGESDQNKSKRSGSSSQPDREQELQDHQALLQGFFQSYRIRNYQPQTLAYTRNFLDTWFKTYSPEKIATYPLMTWQAMAPVIGRERVNAYGLMLIEAGICSSSIRKYFGILRGYFEYVLEHPYVYRNQKPSRLQDLYGPLDQPINEWNIPVHVREDESRGIPLEAERMIEFYSLLRKHYLGRANTASRSRNYAIVVLAGETGLRIDEILHLELHDLFFESAKIQTRWGKAMRGSGKRSRVTLFPPLAQDTLKFYLKIRQKNFHSSESDLLFASRSGRPLSYPVLRVALQEMIECVQRHGFPLGKGLSWHFFRKIFATRFIERFPNRLPVLLELLGHSNPHSVHAYIRHSKAWMDEEIQTVIKKVSLCQSNGNSENT